MCFFHRVLKAQKAHEEVIKVNGKDRGRYQYTICFSFSILQELKRNHFREKGRKKEKVRIELFLMKGKSR
jgi:negative regulator of sigma E activity